MEFSYFLTFLFILATFVMAAILLTSRKEISRLEGLKLNQIQLMVRISNDLRHSRPLTGWLFTISTGILAVMFLSALIYRLARFLNIF